jgi:hypothetical protein
LVSQPHREAFFFTGLQMLIKQFSPGNLFKKQLILKSVKKPAGAGFYLTEGVGKGLFELQFI